jgi:hypothetical protein
MFDGSNQTVTVGMVNNANPKSNTNCSLINEEGTWITPPNAPVSIHRDGNPMTVRCESDQQVGQMAVSPNFKGGYLGLDLLLDLCIISCIVDGVNNSLYEYQPYIVVNMQDK